MKCISASTAKLFKNGGMKFQSVFRTQIWARLSSCQIMFMESLSLQQNVGSRSSRSLTTQIKITSKLPVTMIGLIKQKDSGKQMPKSRAGRPLHRHTLGQIIAYFKYQSTKDMNKIENVQTITKFWQRNYYEHIIRNEKDLKQKTDYILDNPSRWDQDDENPVNH